MDGAPGGQVPPLQRILILDVDGTLIDFNIDYTRLRGLLKELFSEHGLAVNGNLSPLLSSIDGAIDAIGRGEAQRTSLIREAAYSILDGMELESASKATTLPGTDDFLGFLLRNGYNFGFCTKNSSEAVREAFDSLGLPLPEVIVGRGDLPNELLKPNHRHPLETLRRLDESAEPSSAILVGDSGIDIVAAKGCGMVSILIGPMTRGEHPDPDLHFEDLSGFQDHLMGIGRK